MTVDLENYFDMSSYSLRWQLNYNFQIGVISFGWIRQFF